MQVHLHALSSLDNVILFPDLCVRGVQSKENGPARLWNSPGAHGTSCSEPYEK